MPISHKRHLEREYRRISAWCDRRDAIYRLFWLYYRGR